MKKEMNRRSFMKGAGGTALGLGVAMSVKAASAADAPAEKIFRGGTILTMLDDRRDVAAVAVAGGRIIAAGDEAEVMALANAQTEIIELNGSTLMPSFIDSHGHFMNAVQVVKWANVSGVPVGPVKGIADIIVVLKEHQKKFNPAIGEWIIAYGYDGTVLSDGREMTRDDLDADFPDNPVMLIHSSNHGAVLNSAGFALVGLDASSETPPGGVILRKEGSNEPAGLLMETAFLPIFGSMPQPTEAEMLDTFAEAQQMYARVGITTCQEGATHAADLALLRKAATEGRLYLDVVSNPLVFEVPNLIAEYFPGFTGGPMEIPQESAAAFGSYNNGLKLQGVKLVLDGSCQGKTAFWSEPILTPGPAGEADWRGAPTLPPEIINKMAMEFYAKGIQVFAHCNADAAIDMMIDAARAAGVTAEQDRRTVIIHSQAMRPDQLDAYVELGFSPSFFTVHTFFWGDVHLENMGEERAFFISPMASAAAKGIVFSNHNDFSVTPLDPMRMTQSAVARTTRSGLVLGPDERVDVWTALKALTVGGAYQLREEDAKGSIAVGLLADLVVLDANPMTVATDSILDIKVIETFKAGESVYRQAV